MNFENYLMKTVGEDTFYSYYIFRVRSENQKSNSRIFKDISRWNSRIFQDILGEIPGSDYVISKWISKDFQTLCMYFLCFKFSS